ncbi:MAG: GGDEF domain-containing protein [Candidatus Reddybacter sp.]
MADDKQAIDEWKTKYFDQLERLEIKEAGWEQLEATLKRAVGRLSIAAEGQNEGLDGCLDRLRGSIKRNVSHQYLELIIDDISAILAKLEEKKSGPGREVTSALLQLVERLNFPDNQQKACKKIIKKLEKSNDSQRDILLADTAGFLSLAIDHDADSNSNPSLLGRVLSIKPAEKNRPKQPESQCSPATQLSDTGLPDITQLVLVLHEFLAGLPWPEIESQQFDVGLAAIKAVKNIGQLQSAIRQLENITNDWPGEKAGEDKVPRFIVYKDCLIDLIDALGSEEENSDFGTLKASVQLADEDDALEELTRQLSSLLLNPSLNFESYQIKNAGVDEHLLGNPEVLQPTIQELLIRLIEQLIVPKSLEEDAGRVKKNLENKANPADWKQLLKDVANLINSIRLSMQAEKHEFQDFLQQVTDRLKDMDEFLESETTKLESAQNDGQRFDDDIQSNVSTIRDDINQATGLPQLKTLVDTKLELISEHINTYRVAEQKRVEQSRDDVESMHKRMQALEQETESLKKVIVEKNQQAMFDALTKVPNRLFYEQKIEEEFARWQRTDSPLTLAVWDIDFFKKINDNFGHKAGDKVLETIAQLLNKRIRKTDFFARYGGEEFVMLLPDTEAQEALKLADGLRESIEKCSFHYRGEDVRVTASCGLSSFSQGDKVDQIFERADKALYEAKKNGRNRCVLSADHETD